MDRVAVESSNISSIGYSPDEQILEVEFHGGSVYHYLDVPPHVHEELMSAESHGKYLCREIKGTYDYRRVD